MVPNTEPEFNPSSLVEILQWRAARNPDGLAYLFLVDGEEDEVRITYSQLDRRARAIASYLQKQGAEGERAILLFPPGIEYIAD